MRRSTKKIFAIFLWACLIGTAGSLISVACTAISWWLTGSGYVVSPGGAF